MLFDNPQSIKATHHICEGKNYSVSGRSATIASIRDSTHHVLAKMAAPMDAPYFHHRSILPMASEAEEYSVDIVLSDLKSEVDKQGVAQRFAGPDAIAARVREIAEGETKLPLRFEAGGVGKEFEVDIGDVIKIVTEGCAAVTTRFRAVISRALRCFERGFRPFSPRIWLQRIL